MNFQNAYLNAAKSDAQRKSLDEKLALQRLQEERVRLQNEGTQGKQDTRINILDLIKQATAPQTITGATTRYTGDVGNEIPGEYLPNEGATGKNNIYETTPQNYNDPFFAGSTAPLYTNQPEKIAQDSGVSQVWHTPSTTITPDMANPDNLDQLSTQVMAAGGKPGDYGVPTLAETIKMRQEAKKNTNAIKDSKIPDVLMAHGYPYDESLSTVDNWNNAMTNSDPETKTKMMEALKGEKITRPQASEVRSEILRRFAGSLAPEKMPLYSSDTGNINEAAYYNHLNDYDRKSYDFINKQAEMYSQQGLTPTMATEKAIEDHYKWMQAQGWDYDFKNKQWIPSGNQTNSQVSEKKYRINPETGKKQVWVE